MTLRAQVARISHQVETQQRFDEFVSMAKFIMANGGSLSKAAMDLATNKQSEGKLSPKLAAIIKQGAFAGGLSRARLEKAGVAAETLSGSALADYSTIADGFVNSLVNASAFDTILQSAVQLPLITGTVGAVSITAQAFSLSEGQIKPLSKLSVSGSQVNPQKAHCVVVVSDELVKNTSPIADKLIGKELKQSVAVTTDSQFLSTITAGLTPATSTGSTAEAVRADIANMLRAITTGQDSKLFIVTTPLICKSWSMLTSGAHGDSAFPDLGPLGGQIQKIPVLCSDGLLAGQVALIDASGIAAASGDVSLAQVKDGVFAMDSAPTSPPDATLGYVSMWQSNLIGVVVERFFIGTKLRSDAVALTSNSGSYASGNSPP